MKVRIYYHHTDCGGVVYYANYLKFLEEARTEFFEKQGLFIKDLIKENILFVVARQEIDYKAPAFYGDVLSVEAKAKEVGAARIEFEQEIRNQEDKVISLARTIMVCVDKHLKPKQITEDIKKRLLD
jgi:acyl-CoA thioester hydrolase